METEPFDVSKIRLDASAARYDVIADWYSQWVDTESWAHPTIRQQLPALTGPVDGRAVLDVACGDGVFACDLADMGARVTGVDLSVALLAKAHARCETQGQSVTLVHDDAQQLSTIASTSFDGAICILALMDIPDLDATLKAIARVVRPGGWLVIALTHPCFDGPHAEWLEHDDELGRVMCTYLTEGHWISSYPHGVRGQVGAYHRTISTYLNAAHVAGWTMETMVEPATLTRDGHPVSKGREIPRLLLARFALGQ